MSRLASAAATALTVGGMPTPITDEREHRRLATQGQCPDCEAPEQMRAMPYLDDHEDDGVLRLLTPEGEQAGHVDALYRPDDPASAAAMIERLWPREGCDFIDAVDLASGPWLRGCAWMCDEKHVHVSATSYWSYQRMDYELEMLWPPIWRGMSSSQTASWRAPDQEPSLCHRPADWPPNPAHVALRALIETAEDRWWDTPTPLLDHASPRELAGTPAGRKRVITLVRSGRTPAEVGVVAAFDPDRIARRVHSS